MFTYGRTGKENSRSLKTLCVLMIIAQLFFTREAMPASVRDIAYSEEPIFVKLKTGDITEVEFETQIANVTKSISSDYVQIETLGNRMFLLALCQFSGDVFVITQDNASYLLRLSVDEAQNDSRLKIAKPQTTTQELTGRETADTVELMKALMLGEQPPGSSRLDVNNYEIFNNGIFRMVTDDVYQLSGNVKALVLTFENLSDRPIVLPIENIELPGLLAVSADSQMLEAMPENEDKNVSGYATKVYMVVEEVN